MPVDDEVTWDLALAARIDPPITLDFLGRALKGAD